MAFAASAPAKAALPAPAPTEDEAEQNLAGEPNEWMSGPQALTLPHDVQIDLPAGYAFLPQPAAGKFLEKNGNFHNENLLGLIGTDSDPDAQWFITLRFEDEGYVKDDETPDAKEILESFQESLPELNQERAEKGFPALTLGGWHDEPKYDRATHRLIWALNVGSARGDSVNYNTRVLGRRGYLSMNLITSPELLEADKTHAVAILTGTRFNAGATYADYASGDKVAEYGLAGLVLGGAGLGAAVKLGLFAKLGKILFAALLVGKKFIIIGLAGLAALLKRIFGRNEVQTVSPTEGASGPTDKTE